jgi:hypothetical protein
MDGLAARIVHAVAEGRQARSAYYASIDLPDEQQLGPPASATQLQALETALDRKLPPSYRQFLAMHDGWRMVNGAMDLLSVAELLGGPRHDKIVRWQKQMLTSGDTVAANSLVIGASDITPTKLLLDPDTLTEGGEWLMVHYHKGPEDRYLSFLDWLEGSAQGFRELLASGE